ncbi:hypothetical protein HAX54_050449, partial [Datura stramonium]|nr:hypothetical protein [Datura stramonium]
MDGDRQTPMERRSNFRVGFRPLIGSHVASAACRSGPHSPPCFRYIIGLLTFYLSYWQVIDGLRIPPRDSS